MTEPRERYCEKCPYTKMIWHPGQGPLGGWCCPKCGRKIDYKG